MPEEIEHVDGKHRVDQDQHVKEEASYEHKKMTKSVPAGGYLIGRHAECGTFDLLSLGLLRHSILIFVF